MHIISQLITRFNTIALVLFLSACASTEDKQAQQAPQTFDTVIYNKAKSAFQVGDYKMAASLFDPLAEKGNADAQYSLGYLYYHGKGVAKDLTKAMHWFTLSAKQGNQKAIEALNTIERALKKEPQADKPDAHNHQNAQSYAAPSTQQTGIIDLRQQQQSPDQTPALAPRPVQPQPQRPLPTVTAQPETQASVLTSRPAEPQIQKQSQPIAPSYDTQVAQQPLVTEKKPITTAPAPAVKRSAMELEHIKWIMHQPNNYYTIQLASSSNKKHISEFVRTVALDGVYFYGETKNHTTRYYVIHGSFESYSKARRKLRLLNKRGYKDAWIRDIKGIKISLQ